MPGTATNSRPVSPRAKRARPAGIRITRAGVVYILATLVVGATATNTGNNALYLVLAAMLALLAVSGVYSKRNLEALEVDVVPPAEIFAGQPARWGLAVRNHGRWLPRWLLWISTEKAGERGAALLVPFLPRRAVARAQLETLHTQRGKRRLEGVFVSSLFPLGLFRKGLRYQAEVEYLVFPELFEAGVASDREARSAGDHAASRAGRGHDLHALRPFREGDDPRSIHWKQTARTGRFIAKEREAEDARRLSVVLDNAVGSLANADRAASFERLVSEAATAAVDALERNIEVEMVTRGEHLRFGRGARHRHQLLECLALLEAVPEERDPLQGFDTRGPLLWLTLADRTAAGESVPR